MVVCDICGMPAKFESYVYLKPNEGKNMSLCPRCYHLLEEERNKVLAEMTQRVIKIRAEEVKDKDRHNYLIDSIENLK